ncbi:MAG: glycosyltransferase family 2 protein, partial [Chloroflexota bacterium]|nr:glycosyltransferase family 2 protein [Chloroflexota bacterium]
RSISALRLKRRSERRFRTPLREIRLTRILLLITLVSSAVFTLQAVGPILGRAQAGDYLEALAHATFLCVALFMVYGNLLYQFMRLGYLERLTQESPLLVDVADPSSDAEVVILVPSYKEDPRVVRQTLLSAALQDHPRKRIVLLIDDPSNPKSIEDAEGLRTTRQMVANLRALFGTEADRCQEALDAFRKRVTRERFDPRVETEDFAQRLRVVVWWLDRQAALYGPDDHHNVLSCGRCFTG